MSIQVHDFVRQLRKKLISLDRWSKIILMLVADSIALPLCFLIAMLLRLGDLHDVTAYGGTPYFTITALTIVAFSLSGLYRAVIRFIDQPLLRSTGIGLAIVVLIAYSASFSFNAKMLPRSVVMIYWFIAFAYVLASRLLVRHFLRRDRPRKIQQSNVAIYGAGEAGAQLARAMRASDQYRAVCFFDDKHALNHSNVAGLKVYHSSHIAKIIEQFDIGSIILAIPSAAPERRRQIVMWLREYGVEIKTLQTLVELADDEISTQSIREIKIEDLLGRASVPPQIDLFARCILNKSVLVTGAGGSIGSELCRQIIGTSPAQLHLLDHCEFALYTIQQELTQRFPHMKIYGYLGSVCDRDLVQHILETGGIQTIYHAAAYKHVSLVEANMPEGIRNNLLGAKVIAEAAAWAHVETCVLVSTDKAVRPTNIMGASKRVAELIFQAAAETKTKTIFSMVRFGNVLGSSGSVVPLFQQQIEQGGPITITHPDVTRYFMLISEAAQLVIQAGAMASGGEVFVLDMGKPIKIVDLAHTMLEMSGLSEKSAADPHGDIEIRIIGLRPGEKLYEELLIGSDVMPSAHPRIMQTTEYFIPNDLLQQRIAALLSACDIRNPDLIKSSMRDIVPEYAPEGGIQHKINDMMRSAASPAAPINSRSMIEDSMAQVAMPVGEPG